MGPRLCEPRNQQVHRPSVASELLYRVAVLRVRLDAQLADPVPRLGHFIVDALLEMRGIGHMEAGYGMKRRERGAAVGGERPRHCEKTVASWRATVGDPDRLQWSWLSGVSDRCDGDCAWRVVEQSARVIAYEVAIDLVLAARAEDQQVGGPSACQVMQTPPHAPHLAGHHLGVQSHFFAQGCQTLECILTLRGGPRRARLGRGLRGHDLHVSKRQIAFG